MTRTRCSIATAVLVGLTMAMSACGTPTLPSVGLTSPYHGAISPEVKTGSWSWGVDPLDLLFPQNQETVQTCSVFGGPVSVRLDSYVDPGLADTDIQAVASLNVPINGSSTLIPFSNFEDVGQTFVSPPVPPGTCFAVGITAPMTCTEWAPVVEWPSTTCNKIAWPGVTYTIDW